MAAIGGRYSVIRSLFKGSNLALRSTSGLTARDLAVHYDQNDIADMLSQPLLDVHLSHVGALKGRRRARRMFSLGSKGSNGSMEASCSPSPISVNARDMPQATFGCSASLHSASRCGSAEEWLDGRHVDDTDSESDDSSEGALSTSSSGNHPSRSAIGSTSGTSLPEYTNCGLSTGSSKQRTRIGGRRALAALPDDPATVDHSSDSASSAASPTKISNDRSALSSTQGKLAIESSINDWLDCIKYESNKLIAQCTSQQQAPRHDRMLLFFWLPLLLFASLWLAFRLNTVVRWLDSTMLSSCIRHAPMLHLL